MINILDAIIAINSNARAFVEGTDIDNCIIKWMDGTSEISKADIKTKIAELQTAYDNNKYQRDRAVAYKQLKEQLDLLYHDMTAGKGDKTGEWYKHVKAVKDANPKG
jgi:hypothetical protein